MTTITEQLEGLLPADGNLTTKDQRIIAEAVKKTREMIRVAAACGAVDRGGGIWEIKPATLPSVWPRLLAVALAGVALGIAATLALGAVS